MPRRAVILVALALGGEAANGAMPQPSPPVPWTALHFQARKFVLSATSVIRSEVQPADRLAPLLREPPGGNGAPLPARVVQLSVETDLPVGRDEQVRVWLHPVTFAALQTDKRTYGKRQYVKLFRYTADGFYEWRRAPADDREAVKPPHAWLRVREGWTRWNNSLAGEMVAVDPYALLYIVSATQLHRPNSRLTTWIVSRGQPVELVFEDAGLTRHSLNHVESWAGGERLRREDALVRLLHVSAAAAPSTSARQGVDLGFLGMQDELTITLDAESGIPVELSGRTRAVGQLVVRLTRAELLSPPQTHALPGSGDQPRS